MSTGIVEKVFSSSFKRRALNIWYVFGSTPESCGFSRSMARIASSTAWPRVFPPRPPSG